MGGNHLASGALLPWNNVILADEFADIFDGFGGVDRNSETVAPIFDERNAAVKKMIAQVIATGRSKVRRIGICGQTPSDYPEFPQFLVERGIDSISLNPDTVRKTTCAACQFLPNALQAPKVMPA